MDCSTTGFPVLQCLQEFVQTHIHDSVIPSNHLILCCPLLLLPSIFLSIRVFSNESALHIKWPKYWSFSLGISPSNRYSRLISFRTDCFDLAVQGTLKILLQHHGLKASILWSSAFFMEAMEVMGRGNLSHYNGLCLSKGPQYINKCTVSTSLSNIKTGPANLHLLVIKLRLLPTPNPPFCHPL